MRSPLAFFCLGLGLGSGLCASPLTDFLRHKTHVITNTDMVADANNVPSPTAEKPIYYLAVSVGYRDLGPSLAGSTPPPEGDVVKAMTQILDTQHFKLASDRNAAQIVIVYSWGRLNPDRWGFGNGASGGVAPVMNRDQVLSILGGHKVGAVVPPSQAEQAFFGPGASRVSPDAAQFEQISGEPLFVISLAAYDVESAKTAQPKLLWRTHISCPSIGHSLIEVLPTMLTLGAPHIGRETATPVWVDANDRFKPKVEIGPAQVLEN